jgi:hypothetical protein
MARLSLSGLIVLAAFAGALAACGSGPPPQQTFADLRFTNEPPLRLGVASIEVNDEYRPNFDPPHFEQTTGRATGCSRWARAAARSR